MKQPNPIKIAIVWLCLVFVIGVTLTVGNFFNTSSTNNCNWTLVVPYDGGLAKAVCIDFNSFKEKSHEDSVHSPRNRIQDFTTSYNWTGILPQLRVQTQVCEAGVQ